MKSLHFSPLVEPYFPVPHASRWVFNERICTGLTMASIGIRHPLFLITFFVSVSSCAFSSELYHFLRQAARSSFSTKCLIPFWTHLLMSSLVSSSAVGAAYISSIWRYSQALDWISTFQWLWWEINTSFASGITSSLFLVILMKPVSRMALPDSLH